VSDIIALMQCMCDASFESLPKFMNNFLV